MWFDLKGDERLSRCASEGCGGQPTFRLEAGGVGSNYCSGCRQKIMLQERFKDRPKPPREAWDDCGTPHLNEGH
jgi:hypothetical protein